MNQTKDKEGVQGAMNVENVVENAENDGQTKEKKIGSVSLHL